MSVQGDRYIGVIVARPPQPNSPVDLYRQPRVWSIGQFCVAPEYKGFGWGRKLHDVALAYERWAQMVALGSELQFNMPSAAVAALGVFY